jgi:hypothetical protein
MNLTLAHLWQTYNDCVLPANAPEVQRQECQLAFYAGCHSALTSILAVADEAIPEEIGAKLLEDLLKEIDEFKSQQIEN